MNYTYTSATPLNFKKAVTMTVELSQIQADMQHKEIENALAAAKRQSEQDHEDIRALIDAANDQIAITDFELLEMFSDDVQKKYKKNHTEKWNFTTEPEVLLTILNDDTTYTTCSRATASL